MATALLSTFRTWKSQEMRPNFAGAQQVVVAGRKPHVDLTRWEPRWDQLFSAHAKEKRGAKGALADLRDTGASTTTVPPMVVINIFVATMVKNGSSPAVYSESDWIGVLREEGIDDPNDTAAALENLGTWTGHLGVE